jgi:hypothetical protein
MKCLFFLMPFVWSGCGLLLDPDLAARGDVADSAVADALTADASTRDAARVDGAELDGDVDATGLDAGPSDAVVAPDGAPPVDAPAGMLPVVVAGGFGVGLGLVPMQPGSGFAEPVPGAVDQVYVQTSENLAPTMVAGRILDASGVIDTSPTVDPAYPDYVVFHPDRLEDGWYCVEVYSTPSLAGVLLDGEYGGSFPSGDGYEGGVFVYVFGVLRGDVDRSGAVTSEDLAAFDARSVSFTDVDGDGAVTSSDRSIIDDRRGESLPMLTSLPTGASCPPLPGGGG